MKHEAWSSNTLWLLYLFSITGHLMSINKFFGLLSFHEGKESFRFKKLLEFVWTLVYIFHRSMK